VQQPAKPTRFGKAPQWQPLPTALARLDASYLRTATVTVDPTLRRFDAKANPPMVNVQQG
jgi:hypothetical protein